MPYQEVDGYKINIGPIHLRPILGKEVEPGGVVITSSGCDQYDGWDFGVMVTGENTAAHAYFSGGASRISISSTGECIFSTRDGHLMKRYDGDQINESTASLRMRYLLVRTFGMYSLCSHKLHLQPQRLRYCV